MIDQTKEDLIITEVDNFGKSVERANLGELKTEAIIKDLEKIKKSVGLNEEFYVTREKSKERERKIKKILFRVLIVSGTFAVGMLIENKYIGLLPLWVQSAAMSYFAIIFILSILITTYYDGEI